MARPAVVAAAASGVQEKRVTPGARHTLRYLNRRICYKFIAHLTRLLHISLSLSRSLYILLSLSCCRMHKSPPLAEMSRRLRTCLSLLGLLLLLLLLLRWLVAFAVVRVALPLTKQSQQLHTKLTERVSGSWARAQNLQVASCSCSCSCSNWSQVSSSLWTRLAAARAVCEPVLICQQ